MLLHVDWSEGAPWRRILSKGAPLRRILSKGAPLRRILKSRVAGLVVALLSLFATYPAIASGTHAPSGPKITKETKKDKRRAWGGPLPTRWVPHFGANRSPVIRKRPSRESIVLAVARAQLGKPYSYGAAGPSAFDCSGLTMFAYHRAGVELPHNDSAQRAATKSIPSKSMKPGDLVFYPGHVGIYIGHGKMIHAPQTGRNVEIAPLREGMLGVGRPA